MNFNFIFVHLQAANIRKSKFNKESLDSDEFLKFFQMLTSRPEIDAVFRK